MKEPTCRTKLAVALGYAQCLVLDGERRSAVVKGFGCRPDHEGGAGHAGRRRKASRGGNRGRTARRLRSSRCYGDLRVALAGEKLDRQQMQPRPTRLARLIWVEVVPAAPSFRCRGDDGRGLADDRAHAAPMPETTLLVTRPRCRRVRSLFMSCRS